MNCRCCSSTSLKLIMDLGSQPWGNDFIPIAENREATCYPLELYFCNDCSMVQIGHTVAKETMFSNHNYMSGTTRSLARHFESVVEDILRRCRLTDEDYVLDIGGNDGTFLSRFKERNIRVLNVDSGRKQVERSIANGIECLHAFFNSNTAKDIRTSRGPAKVIHGSGIFFHLEELHSVFDGIRHLLAEDGVLVAEFIYLPTMVKQCAFDQIYHEHLLYYTLTTLSNLLSRNGLEIYDCTFSPIHGGSCIAYIGHRGQQKKTAAAEASIASERGEGFLNEDIFNQFAGRVVNLRQSLREIIFELKRSGKSIQTLGAPVKGSTIINYCGLSEKEIDCATEINELKCGTYIPGTRIPVVHQDSVEPPDVYFLLSWNFKDEILGKLEQYRKAGGRILIPIPNPHLI